MRRQRTLNGCIPLSQCLREQGFHACMEPGNMQPGQIHVKRRAAARRRLRGEKDRATLAQTLKHGTPLCLELSLSLPIKAASKPRGAAGCASSAQSWYETWQGGRSQASSAPTSLRHPVVWRLACIRVRSACAQLHQSAPCCADPQASHCQPSCECW